MENIKIICTLGPSSFNEETILKLKNRGVNFFRINLSHTPIEKIEHKIQALKELDVPIMIDTEGSQVRTGNQEPIYFEEGDTLKICKDYVICDSEKIFLTPPGIVEHLEEGDLIHIDFNSVLIKISSTQNTKEGFVEGVVLIGGQVGGRKGVHIESSFDFPIFSEKDKHAIEIAKNYGIEDFSLSFIRKPEDIFEFKSLYPKAYFLSKIETKDAVRNIDSILDISDGILIDRGDLSREIPLEKIPFIQKRITKKANEKSKKIFIATNTLENMSNSLKPLKSEINDIANCLLDGVDGFVLTKETAVGNYPVQTVNMLNNIIKEYKNKREKEEGDFYSNLLPLPHGGKLVDRVLKKNLSIDNLNSMQKVSIDEETLMDLEQIAVGSFSPLEGFMCKDDALSVIQNMRLKNGLIWPLPVLLQVDNVENLQEGDDVALSFQGDKEIYGVLHLDEIYQLNKEYFAKNLFNTLDKDHPGVKKFLEGGNYFLGGKIDLIKRRASPNKMHELTPRQVRDIFLEKGWSRVVGFHTRNVIHKSHEFVQMEAMKRNYCDGLFVHPVIGKKKKGDFEAEIIVQSYDMMMKGFYPKGKVVFSALATYSRYCGPREALFTALIRKNFGCTHFIVGRDHTGVKEFYGPHDSHKIFDKFRQDEIGILPVKFDKVFYSTLKNTHFHESEFPDHPEKEKLHISGTQARTMFKRGEKPPAWFMRPEISQLILEKIAKGKRVFVE